ncbi:hypothetical protein [Clostridium sp. C2-6-12]|uniref:hypothetical protein n=1 Tax=Clostridium sp. C2-6-12 TaxID=2698832 RepID=UPI001370589C|nr:hypothetical protein [Clostridium sp. C2-6-12]
MDFLTSSILSGIAWDGIKAIGTLTGTYIKSKLTHWIVDEITCKKIAKKINDMPEEYKKSSRFLEVAIEEDQELIDILKLIKADCRYTQDNGGSYNKDSNVINGSGNNVENNRIYNYYGITPQELIQQKNVENESNEKYSRKSLKPQIDNLLNENEEIYTLYGPTFKNKEDIYSSKADIWREMAKDIIVPNNTRIVKLLEDNKRLLTQDEIKIFIKFKIHAKGFEENQNRVEKRAEYLQFPVEIYDILK